MSRRISVDLGQPTAHPALVASPAYRPGWRDRLAVRLANFILKAVASKDYCRLAADMYTRGFNAAMGEIYIGDMQPGEHVTVELRNTTLSSDTGGDKS